MKRRRTPHQHALYASILTGVVVGVLMLSYYVLPDYFAVSYPPMFGQMGASASSTNATSTTSTIGDGSATSTPAKPKVKRLRPATHVATPQAVKGIYMTSWVAGVKKMRDRVVKLIDDTEVNSIVIDIKDYSGTIAFEVYDPVLKNEPGLVERRIPDLQDFIDELHSKNIYVIGRVAVFQDAHLVKLRPDLAVKTLDGKKVWKDRKGISWVDADSKEAWDRIIAIAKEAHKQGFDEINFDYIRFPSDGNMKDISYPFSKNKVKSSVLKEFFTYLHENLKDTGMKTSADLFGMTTTNYDDLFIGQVLENALPYFDFICPMVYPSHYPTGFIGIKNPAAKPYDVVLYSMEHAYQRARTASSTQMKLRPWLQDFNLGATYNAPMIRAQIKATYDSGLTSWLLWDPKVIYTRGGLLDAGAEDETNATSTPAGQASVKVQ